MPFSLSGSPIVTFAYVDNNRRFSDITLYLPTAVATEAAAEAWVEEVGDQLQALSNARILGAHVNWFYSQDTPPAPTPESEVERKLFLGFNSTNRRSKYTVQLPSPIFTIEQANTNQIDPANPLVAALVQTMINGPVGFENSLTTSTGFSLTELYASYIMHRNRQP